MNPVTMTLPVTIGVSQIGVGGLGHGEKTSFHCFLSLEISEKFTGFEQISLKNNMLRMVIKT